MTDYSCRRNVIAKCLRKMNKLGLVHAGGVQFYSEIRRSCHVFDGTDNSMRGAHLNMKEGFLKISNSFQLSRTKCSEKYWSMEIAIVRKIFHRERLRIRLRSRFFLPWLPYSGSIRGFVIQYLIFLPRIR